MRTILLIEKGGKHIHVITAEPVIDFSIIGFEEKETENSIPKKEFAYKLIRLENGREKETIGYIPTIEVGEVNLYKPIGRKTFEHYYGKGFKNVVVWVKKEKINILELIYRVYQY